MSKINTFQSACTTLKFHFTLLPHIIIYLSRQSVKIDFVVVWRLTLNTWCGDVWGISRGVIYFAKRRTTILDCTTKFVYDYLHIRVSNKFRITLFLLNSTGVRIHWKKKYFHVKHYFYIKDKISSYGRKTEYNLLGKQISSEYCLNCPRHFR